MIKIKKDELWTLYPNCILDNINDFTGIELKIIGTMLRNCKTKEQFSINRIKTLIGHSSPTINKYCKVLVKKQFLFVCSSYKIPIEFAINWKREDEQDV